MLFQFCGAVFLSFALILPAAWAEAGDQTVRVRVLSRYHPENLIIETDRGEPTALGPDSRYPARFAPGAAYRVRVPGREARTYTGALEAWWTDGEIVLVNEAPLEDYVAGVVAAELGEVHKGAMRAQAVIARTWALRHKDESRAYSFGDLANHQVFHGYSRRAARAAERIESTQGVILTYDGSTIDAVYHAQCGDRVYAAGEIWGGRGHEYLAAVTLPETIAATDKRRWTRRLPRNRVDPLFQTGAGPRPTYRVAWRDGRLGVHILPGKWVGIDRFRLTVERALGWNTLRSNAFTITGSGEELVFRGEGFGHLVGLCQGQAVQLAEQGWSYEEILHLFYPGTRLERTGER